MSEALLKALETLRGDLGSLRADINTGRAEASAAHLETGKQLAVLSESITNINTRVASMESKSHGRYRAAGALMVGTVAALARAALMGK
jgi:hypothetical protein